MEQIANPAGLRVLEALVDLIKNASSVDKILTEIHKARDEANKRIAIVGDISDIERLRNEAAARVRKRRARWRMPSRRPPRS